MTFFKPKRQEIDCFIVSIRVEMQMTVESRNLRQPIPTFCRFRFGFSEPPRDGLWHKYTPIWPVVRLIDGTLGWGTHDIDCRYNSDARAWEYREVPQSDAEMNEEWADRQW